MMGRPRKQHYRYSVWLDSQDNLKLERLFIRYHIGGETVSEKLRLLIRALYERSLCRT
jgi:hypothetical protein